jgi:xanthine phosphoribosyltransferase
MQRLIERLLEGERHLGKGMVRVSDFLNHQVDAALLAECGQALAARWRDYGLTKVLTAETSGIAPALAVATALGLPLVFARKRRLGTLGADVYSATAPSPTHGGSFDLVVASSFLQPNDRVLVVDDILASGRTIVALHDIIQQARAQLVGIAAIVEKGYSNGRRDLARYQVPITSLAVIEQADENGLQVRPGIDA